MNYVIHLTENCNLRCRYCYEDHYYSKSNRDISFEDIMCLIDREAENNTGNCFITFYGGEPLLKKDLIYKTVQYAKGKHTNTKFDFSMTTNGTLLDEAFVQYMKDNSFLGISYSIDGTESTHDANRIFQNGNGSYSCVKENAITLLKHFKDVVAAMVVTKNNVSHLSENIKHLYQMGFKTFNTLFDYSEAWNDEDIIVIKEEFEKIADFYYHVVMSGDSINIPILNEKIHFHIHKTLDCNETCLDKMKAVNVGVDGKFYFCMQFVYNPDYVIGDCQHGIDPMLRSDLLTKLGKEKEECADCVVKNRCKHRCPCKNFILTNDVNGLSPIVCEFERLFIHIADDLAERLYQSNNKMILHH